MQSVQIKYDHELSKEIYLNYFKREKQREFKKFPGKLIALLSLIVISIGIATDFPFLWIFGLITLTINGLFLFYFFMRFEQAINKFFKDLDRKAKNGETDFEFSFDSEKLVYKSENTYTEIKWDLIKSYEENGRDVYLFYADRVLLDIFSERIMGLENYEEFLQILKGKFDHKPEAKKI